MADNEEENRQQGANEVQLAMVGIINDLIDDAKYMRTVEFWNMANDKGYTAESCVRWFLVNVLHTAYEANMDVDELLKSMARVFLYQLDNEERPKVPLVRILSMMPREK